MVKIRTPAEHEKYWRDRYNTQGDRAIVHCKAAASGVATQAANDDWAKGIEPPVEAALMNYRRMIGPKKAFLLDFGCGVGRWYPFLSGVNAGGLAYNYLGVDLVQSALDFANIKYGAMFAPIQTNPLRLDVLADATIDVVFTCTVLQHIVLDEMLERVTTLFRRIMTKRGLLILIENVEPGPNAEHIHFRSVEDYANLFEWVGMHKVGEYTSFGQRHAILVGERWA